MPQKSRGSKRRAMPDTFSATADGQTVNVEAQEFPGILVMFAFDPPGILVNAEPKETFTGRIALQQLPDFSKRLSSLKSKHGFKDEVTFPLEGDAADHGRLLAKIGHAYAVAELGLGTFRPYLTDIILNKPPIHIGHYVGGLFGDAPQDDDLHTIVIEEKFWGDEHVVVEVQLFADRSMPKSLVVVGERLPKTPRLCR